MRPYGQPHGRCKACGCALSGWAPSGSSSGRVCLSEHNGAICVNARTRTELGLDNCLMAEISFTAVIFSASVHPINFCSRYNSNVIRLANNNLVDTTGLYQMALDVVEFPEDIAWLDLSFNEISVVSDDILEFPGMVI